MELGNLTLMCFNLVCVSAAGLLVFWALMHMQGRGGRRPRVYDEPPFEVRTSFMNTWRGQEERT